MTLIVKRLYSILHQMWRRFVDAQEMIRDDKEVFSPVRGNIREMKRRLFLTLMPTLSVLKYHI